MPAAGQPRVGSGRSPQNQRFCLGVPVLSVQAQPLWVIIRFMTSKQLNRVH